MITIVDILGSIDDKFENNEKIIAKIHEVAILKVNKDCLVNNKKITLLGKISFVKGKKPLEQNNNLMNYLSIENLDNYTQTYACATNMVLSNDGDILMVMDGASSGKVYDGDKGIVSSTMARIDINGYDKDFLYWYLKAKEKLIVSQNTGSAIPHANKKFIQGLNIPIIKNNSLYKHYREIVRSLICCNQKLKELKGLYLKKFFD